MTGIRVRTPSRLHFGLLGWGPLASRQFGGVGLMIDAPGIELIAEPSESWEVEGPLSMRVDPLIKRVQERMRQAGVTLPAARIRILEAPREHVGLGVGTQLSLATAAVMWKLAGTAEPTVEQLARLTGRGNRSGIGLHGFQQGGLIVDGGRKREYDVPPLLARVAFPEDWSILIVQPPGFSGLHGPDEVRAFAHLPPIPLDVTDRLCRLLLLEILPAIIEHDLPAFGAALSDLQTRVGACFAPAQGGIYTSPIAAAIVEELKMLGFVGIGQSSWGPTLYGFVPRSENNITASAERIRQRFGLDEASVFSASAANRGAVFSTDG